MPLRAVWGAASDCALVACMKRGVDVLPVPSAGGVTSGSGPKKGAGGQARLSSELLTAIPPRVAPHPWLPVLAAATGSGRVHVFRG